MINELTFIDYIVCSKPILMGSGLHDGVMVMMYLSFSSYILSLFYFTLYLSTILVIESFDNHLTYSEPVGLFGWVRHTADFIL